MSFYIFFALALGAISAVTDAPIAQPAVANVVRACVARREVRGVRAVVTPFRRPSARRITELFAFTSPHRSAVPLSGAITPRAPGRSC